MSFYHTGTHLDNIFEPRGGAPDIGYDTWHQNSGTDLRWRYMPLRYGSHIGWTTSFHRSGVSWLSDIFAGRYTVNYGEYCGPVRGQNLYGGGGWNDPNGIKDQSGAWVQLMPGNWTNLIGVTRPNCWIPANRRLTGIRVRLTLWNPHDNSNAWGWHNVRIILLYGGNQLGNEARAQHYFNNTRNHYSAGGQWDAWGGVTAGHVNDGSFGAAVQFQNNFSSMVPQFVAADMHFEFWWTWD